MQIHIDKPGSLESNTIIEEFGFLPSVSITFRVNKNADMEEVRKCLILGCMELLSNNSEDAVLLFNGETVIMWRRETMLLLNKIKGFWTDDVLAQIPIAYNLETMPNI